MKRIPFQASEVEIKSYIPPYRPWMSPTPVFSPVISPRENFLAFYRGENPLWMPSFWDQKRFDPRIIPDNVAKGMVSDDKPFDSAREGGGKDMFGVDWVFDVHSNGAMVVPGNPKAKDINRWEDYITFPNLDSWDWEGCSKANKERLDDGLLTQMTIYSGLFERLISFLDMTGAMIALVDEEQKPGVHRLFDRLCTFYDGLFSRMKKWFDCDAIWFQDDWGSQRAPFFSPETCREMIAPYMKRIVDSVHRHDMFFELHSCGKNEALVPIYIQCGVDAWHGQEVNDKRMLYKKYGRQIKLGIAPEGKDKLVMGLPPMTEAETRAAFRELLDHYRDGNVFMGMFMGYNPEANVILYEESRKAYDS